MRIAASLVVAITNAPIAAITAVRIIIVIPFIDIQTGNTLDNLRNEWGIITCRINSSCTNWNKELKFRRRVITIFLDSHVFCELS